MLGILISAAVLVMLVKIVAQDDAEPDFWPMAGVALISGLASAGANISLSDTLGPFAFLVGDVVLIPALMWVADISLKHSTIVAGIYLLFQIALGVVFAMLLGG